MLCSGTSEPHLKAIASEIREQAREKGGQKAAFSDGIPASHWVVLDFSDVLVHIFTEEKRAFYSLESLWGDAKRLPLEEPVPDPVVAPPVTAPAKKKR